MIRIRETTPEARRVAGLIAWKALKEPARAVARLEAGPLHDPIAAVELDELYAELGQTAKQSSLLGPLTMACFNPARDLGPRVFSALAGWGEVPFLVNGTGWWMVYIVAPVVGGLLGGGIYTACFKRAYVAGV